MGVGSDRAILEKQRKDAKYEAMVASNNENNKVAQKAVWENKTAAHQRNLAIRRRIDKCMGERNALLEARRDRLKELLDSEQRGYENEMVAVEETQQERVDKMTKRAFELKKRREEERQRVVQEKLYQQWREGVDELRKADSNLFCMEVLAARDDQVYEKLNRKDALDEEDEYYNKLWNEGYKAKLEREHREEELRKDRNENMKKVLDFQVDMRAKFEEEELKMKKFDEEEAKQVFAQQEREAKEEQVRNQVLAKLERKKVDEFAAIQKEIKDKEIALEAEMDKNFILSYLKAEQEAGEKKHADQCVAKEESIALMKRKEAEKLQREEELKQQEQRFIEQNLKQWEKRAEQWDKEAECRAQLQRDVLEGRSKQVEKLENERQQEADEVVEDRIKVDAHFEDHVKIEAEKEEKGKDKLKKHQEGLYRQMDFHQVQRMREMQQFKIERRQGDIQERKFQQAIKSEKKKLDQISADIYAKREQRVEERRVLSEQKEIARKETLAARQAPWEK